MQEKLQEMQDKLELVEKEKEAPATASPAIVSSSARVYERVPLNGVSQSDG